MSSTTNSLPACDVDYSASEGDEHEACESTINLKTVAMHLTAAAARQRDGSNRKDFDWPEHLHKERPSFLKLHQWLLRIQRYSLLSSSCFLIAVTYVERLGKCGLPLTNKNCHLLLLVTSATASKWHDDQVVSNKRYADIGGIDLALYNRLELTLLRLLDFRLQCSSGDFQKHFQKHVATSEKAATTTRPLGRSSTSQPAELPEHQACKLLGGKGVWRKQLVWPKNPFPTVFKLPSWFSSCSTERPA